MVIKCLEDEEMPSARPGIYRLRGHESTVCACRQRGVGARCPRVSLPRLGLRSQPPVWDPEAKGGDKNEDTDFDNRQMQSGTLDF